jgi:hypothetical protein
MFGFGAPLRLTRLKANWKALFVNTSSRPESKKGLSRLYYLSTVLEV